MRCSSGIKVTSCALTGLLRRIWYSRCGHEVRLHAVNDGGRLGTYTRLISDGLTLVSIIVCCQAVDFACSLLVWGKGGTRVLVGVLARKLILNVGRHVGMLRLGLGTQRGLLVLSRKLREGWCVNLGIEIVITSALFLRRLE